MVTRSPASDMLARASGGLERVLAPDKPFEWKTLNRYHGPASAHDAHGRRKIVCVLGAGAAGLATAHELSEAGHTVVIIEASRRVGGRIQTHRFGETSYAELGAMRIPDHHATTLHFVDAAGLTGSLTEFVNDNRDAYFHLRGRRARRRDWRKVAEAFDLEPSELMAPWDLADIVFSNAREELHDAERWGAFKNDLIASPALRRYQNLSLGQSTRQTLSDEAAEFMLTGSGLQQYRHAAFLETLVDDYNLYDKSTRYYTIKGGMDLLPRRMAETLTTRPNVNMHLRSRASAVRVRPGGVSVDWIEDNTLRSRAFDYVVCALPAPAVARLEFDPPLPPRQQAALVNLPYASSTKTLALANTRVWEHDHGVYGGGCHTDLMSQQIWLPSDNAVRDRSGRWVGRDPDVSHRPSAFTAAYCWEWYSRRLSSLDDIRRERDVIDSVELVFPGVSRVISDLVHVVWDRETESGGAFAYFYPNDHQQYQGPMSQAFPVDSPRVFFAGEHLSIAHAWIQGALQTGVESAIRVAASPPPVVLGPAHRTTSVNSDIERTHRAYRSGN